MPKRNSAKGELKELEKAPVYMVPLRLIGVSDRPEPGAKPKLFVNQRSASSFTEESLASLRQSIRTDELLKQLVVRPKGKGYELIAGERRFRVLSGLVENDVFCFHSKLARPAKWRVNAVVCYRNESFATVVKQTGDEVQIAFLDEAEEPTGDIVTVSADLLLPTARASKLYAKVECKVVENCSDERALRINMAENQEHQSLTPLEQIEAVERLVAMGIKQMDIKYMLSTNITWVCQTANFRKELPPAAFQKLLNREMRRNVAVDVMGFDAKHRDRLYAEMLQAEADETAAKLHALQLEEEAVEDEVDILTEAAKDDPKAAKKVTTAKKKLAAAKEKKKQAEKTAGQLQQGHLQTAANNLGISPKKAKMLPRKQLVAMIAQLDDILSEEEAIYEPESEEEIPREELNLVRAVADAILHGKNDPMCIIRKFHDWGDCDCCDTETEADTEEVEVDEVDVDEQDAPLVEESDEYDIDADIDNFDVYAEEEYDDSMDDVDNWE